MTKRRFIPGEEWLYIKIYSGPKFLEEILVAEVYELVDKLYKENRITKFFFVRYLDQGNHIRLRFLLKDKQFTGSIIQDFSSVLGGFVESRLISNITIDTYNREMERYGPATIEHVETIFSVDSWLILNTLKSTDDYDLRWLSGIKIMDVLLDKLGFTLPEKYQIHESYYQQYAKEFDANKYLKDELKDIYRNNKVKVEQAISANTSNLPEAQFTNVSEEDMNMAVTAIGSLKNSPSFSMITKSIMHMHYNRMFRTRQRTYELAIYYMLSNAYKSMSIRSNKYPLKQKVN
jgi:thiopeptide-type bacteriocin biosynthesis protein